MKNYYDDNGVKFFNETKDLDMSKLYDFFLKRVRSGGNILDAGCGSGRDFKKFLEDGFQVTAIDQSQKMVDLAAGHTGLDVLQKSFLDIDYDKKFDAIWCSASLLHVKKSDMSKVYSNLYRALKSNGILFVSYKHGDFEGEREGRYFSDYTVESFTEFIRPNNLFKIEDIFIREDARPNKVGFSWLNAILSKIG